MRQDHQNMIDEIQGDENAGLSPWEMDLIECLDGQSAFGSWDRDKIEEIWAKVFGG